MIYITSGGSSITLTVENLKTLIICRWILYTVKCSVHCYLESILYTFVIHITMFIVYTHTQHNPTLVALECR